MKKYSAFLFLILGACVPSKSTAVDAERTPAAVTPAETFKAVNTRAKNKFAKQRKPYGNEARAVGGYSAGCLFGGVKMPNHGEGFELVRLSRGRNFAHPVLADLLVRAGKELAPHGSMLYGDLAQARGGPMPGGHVSHQSGLDADIWFYNFPAGKKMTAHQRENLWGASVLKSNFVELDERKWSEAYTRHLMWFAGQPETDRIFVNAAIKKRLCKQFPGDERLARLRPWYFHHDHFHLRLKCPAGDPSCVPQASAGGIECEDKDLAFWFSEEVIGMFTKPSPAKEIETNLPLECKPLVGG